MEALTSASMIRDALGRIGPDRIAVAYVGIGWKKYIDTRKLKTIIISPTNGSNAKAIEEIMEEIGIDNVYLHDNLHAKLYLSDSTLLLGSCNLSDNGLSDGRLIESALISNNKDIVNEFSELFEHIKVDAEKKYSDNNKKLKKIEWLHEENGNDIISGRLGKSRPGERPEIVSISDYKSKLDRIHIVWYELNDKTILNEKKIENDFRLKSEKFDKEQLENSMIFTDKDDVRVCDWILCWRCKKDGYPAKNGDINWMRVHHVVNDAICEDHDHKNVAMESKYKYKGNPPFVLDKPTKSLIRQLLSEDKFACLRDNESGEPWLVPTESCKEFVKCLRERARSLQD